MGRTDQADENQRPSHADHVENQRRHEAGRRDDERAETLEGTEQPGEDGVGHEARRQGEDPDVDHRVPDPETCQHQQDQPSARYGTGDRQGKPPEHDTHSEQRRETPAIGEHRHAQRSDHRAGTDRRSEHADA